MRFAVVVLACVLAVANAQFNKGQYFPEQGRYQTAQYTQYNNNKPYNRNNNYQNYKTYKPFASSTSFPRPSVTVTPAPIKYSGSAVPIVAPAVKLLPVVPAVVASRVAADARAAETIKYGNEINPDGSYSYFFETNNGIAAQAQGTPRNFGGNPPVVPDVAQGSFSWYSPEGQLVNINYVADENGYQPTGDAIPQPPELPPQIARALAYTSRLAPKSRK